MQIAVAVSDPEDWTALALNRAFSDLRVKAVSFSLSDLTASISDGVSFRRDGLDLSSFDAIVVRDMGRGQPSDVAFRFEYLVSLQSCGVRIVNSPDAILRSANKFATSVALARDGIPTPRTTVTSSLDEATSALALYGKAVSKPLFGYKGIDVVLLTSSDIPAMKEIIEGKGIIYLQEFVKTRIFRDIRAFVVDGKLAGAIYRVAMPGEWISNLARGGRAEPCPVTEELERLSLLAAKAVGADYCGVDLLESDVGLMVIEVNGTPSGRGIHSALGIDVARSIAEMVLEKGSRGALS
jgi:tetrahydromethanopterin:alpha-L-glutamate ligase